MKYGFSALTDSSVRTSTAIQVSVLAGTTEVKLLSSNHVIDSTPGVVPARGYNVLNGILQRQHATHALCLVTDITVLLVHTDHDAWHLGPDDNRKELSARRITPAKPAVHMPLTESTTGETNSQETVLLVLTGHVHHNQENKHSTYHCCSRRRARPQHNCPSHPYQP